MVDLSEVLPYIEKYSPLLIGLLQSPAELVVITLLCIAFQVTPDKLVQAMLDANARDELADKLKNIVFP